MKIKSVTFLFMLAVLSACTKAADSAQTATQTPVSTPAMAAKTVCADHAVCEELRKTESACSANSSDEAACKAFVAAFQKLAVVHDCQRSFDTKPVPSVWLCDEDETESATPKILERSATTLSKLKFQFANEFYGSDQFRSVLDGELAETHEKASLARKKIVK